MITILVLTGTPDNMLEGSDSDVSSTTYSNFTYWRLKEQDTYKSLPMSPSGTESEQKHVGEDKAAPRLVPTKCFADGFYIVVIRKEIWNPSVQGQKFVQSCENPLKLC